MFLRASSAPPQGPTCNTCILGSPISRHMLLTASECLQRPTACPGVLHGCQQLLAKASALALSRPSCSAATAVHIWRPPAGARMCNKRPSSRHACTRAGVCPLLVLHAPCTAPDSAAAVASTTQVHCLHGLQAQRAQPLLHQPALKSSSLQRQRAKRHAWQRTGRCSCRSRCMR